MVNLNHMDDYVKGKGWDTWLYSYHLLLPIEVGANIVLTIYAKQNLHNRNLEPVYS